MSSDYDDPAMWEDYARINRNMARKLREEGNPGNERQIIEYEERAKKDDQIARNIRKGPPPYNAEEASRRRYPELWEGR